MGMGIMARRPQNIIDPRGMFNILIEGRPDEGAPYLTHPVARPTRLMNMVRRHPGTAD